MARSMTFDDEGKMLYGWVDGNNAERIENTDGAAFKEAPITSVAKMTAL